MHDLLSEYISRKKTEQKEKTDRQKRELLISEGLYERVYSDKNTYDDEYPFEEWDEENQRSKYYKKEPITLTDEEYAELKKWCEPKVDTKKGNGMVITWQVLAWIIFIGGFFLGLAQGGNNVMIYWGSSFLSGMFALSIAEVIRLLNDIKNK